jgi:triphosphoribosyl-dephospho-CoA synthase
MLACLWEAVSPKPGNVHRGADFSSLTLGDLVTAAVAIGRPLENAVERPLGRTVWDATAAVASLVDTNAYLGTILLLAPLAAAPQTEPLRSGLKTLLARLGPEDAELVYSAIRLARPGGLGSVSEHDVHGLPPADLLLAMQAASDRDLVARQYATGFQDLFETIVPWLEEEWTSAAQSVDAIIALHIRIMSRFPDSLIARKCGPGVAAESSIRAGAVWQCRQESAEAYHGALADFDFWLRQDGHRRNPGTTADLVAAALFVALREGTLRPPYRLWSHAHEL